MNNKNKSILFMLLSSFSFSAMQIIVKLLPTIPLMEKVFFRNLASLIFSYIIIKKLNLSFLGNKNNRKHLFYRSFYGFLGVVLFFYATSKMLASDAAMLNKLSPVFVTMIAYFFLKERVSKIQISSLIISLIGSLFIIRPKFNISALPASVGLLSAIVSAAAYIFITAIGKKESIYTIVFYYSLFSVLASTPFLFFSFKIPDFKELLLLIILSVLACAGQIALTLAYNSCKASKISIYDYTNIIFSSLLGFVILKEIPSVYSVLGGILIIGSSLFEFFSSKTCRHMH